jgi:hypothetical protein
MWVMSQVGHADSKLTTDVYNQLHQRARRQHREAFDALVQAARERLYPTSALTDLSSGRDATHGRR